MIPTFFLFYHKVLCINKKPYKFEEREKTMKKLKIIRIGDYPKNICMNIKIDISL